MQNFTRSLNVDAITGERVFRQRIRVFIDRSATRRTFGAQEPDPIVPVTALKFRTAEVNAAPYVTPTSREHRNRDR